MKIVKVQFPLTPGVRFFAVYRRRGNTVQYLSFIGKRRGGWTKFHGLAMQHGSKAIAEKSIDTVRALNRKRLR